MSNDETSAASDSRGTEQDDATEDQVRSVPQATPAADTEGEAAADQQAEPDQQDGENPAAEQADSNDEVPDEELAEIEEERKQRLDPDNRPENAEVDNSGAELPTVKAFDEEHPDEDTSAGTSDPGQIFRDMEISDDEIEEMAKERERRLDPDNRPEGAEVDNTGRTMEDGHFVD